MAFLYVSNELAAVDEHLGLKVQQDLTFHDETTVRLKVRDTVAEIDWSMTVQSVFEVITYDSPGGPRTERAMVAARLPRGACEPIFREIAAVRRTRNICPLEPADAAEAVAEGAKLVLTTGGALLKFVPGFQIAWD